MSLRQMFGFVLTGAIGWAAAPQIVTPPKSQAVVMGDPVHFSVVATGTEPLTYEWRKDGLGIPDPIISIPPVPVPPRLDLSFTNFEMLGTYTVKVSNAEGSVTSPGAVLSFSLAARQRQGPSIAANAGASIDLPVEGIGDGLRYQWLKNGITLPNATTATLRLGPLQSDDQNRYDAVVSNAAGSVHGATYVVSVVTAPFIITHPSSQTTDVGRDVTFSIAARGPGPVTYQWLKDGHNLVGARSPTLTLARVQLTDAGAYSVDVANAAGVLRSSEATLTVTVPAGLPVITRHPVDQHLHIGDTVALDVAADATALPLSTTWYYNGNRIISRATGVRASEGGSYRAAVTDYNRVGPVLSNPAIVTLANDAYYTFTTIAGFSRHTGYKNGAVADAAFSSPQGIAVGKDGTVYIADTGSSRIRKISADGIVSDLAGGSFAAGSGDGTGADARFWFPSGIAVDATGNVFVSDPGSSTIRKVTPDGVATTLAGSPGKSGAVDGVGNAALFYGAYAMTIDPAGNLYVAERENATIRKITPAGAVTTVAGTSGSHGFVDANGANARFQMPSALAADAAGNVFVADNNTIRRIAPNGDVTSLLATGAFGRTGVDGVATELDASDGLAIDRLGNFYAAGSTTISKISGTSITTIGGTSIIEARLETDGIDGTGEDAKLRNDGLAVDATGQLFVLESLGVIQKGVPPDGGDVPLITTHPLAQTAAAGSDAVFMVEATSPSPLTYQWQHGGVYLIGQTQATLTVRNVTDADAGRYSVLVQNRSGIAVSNAVTLTVAAPPTITIPPRSVASLATGTLSVSATLAANYQWILDGAPIEGATNSSIAITAPGIYRVWVSNGAGAVLSDEAFVMGPSGTSRLSNLSVRNRAGSGGDALTLGFVVATVNGGSSLPLLIRGIGPGLRTFDIADAMSDPGLRLYRSQTVVATNDNWGDHADEIAPVARRVGAFALSDRSGRDAALLATANAALYNVEVTPASGGPGTALAELYDAAPADAAYGDYARLINVSARTHVGPDNPLIAGLTITGTAAKRVLIRAVGPSLRVFDVADAVAHPQLSLYADRQLVASNDDWRRNDGAYTQMAARVGAFPLSWDHPDAALIVTLPPGLYSAVVSTADQASGSALIEVYDLDE